MDNIYYYIIRIENVKKEIINAHTKNHPIGRGIFVKPHFPENMLADLRKKVVDEIKENYRKTNPNSTLLIIKDFYELNKDNIDSRLQDAKNK